VNSKVTLGSLGRFQRMMPPPAPPQYLRPTITGRTVALLLPAGFVVIKVLAVQSEFIAAWVEKSGGGVIIVDAATAVLEDDKKVTDCIDLTAPEDDMAIDTPVGALSCVEAELRYG